MGYEFGDDRSGGTVQKKTRAVRPWLLVVLASLILILAAVGVVLFVQGVGQRIVAQHESGSWATAACSACRRSCSRALAG